MNSFLGDDFLLESEFARSLFHDIAKPLPIVDFHNHLPPDRIASNQPFQDFTDLWLNGDHYKWRAMRACGISESLITGSASFYDKFMAWAKVLPQTLCNPLYSWSHLELLRTFGIRDLLTSANASSIWNQVNELLTMPDFTPRKILQKMNVELIATTDDPADTLEHHLSFASEQNTQFRMVPTFRPDQAFAFNGFEQWNRWLDRLSETSNSSISNLEELKSVLSSRVDFFHEVGCRMADHGISVLPNLYHGLEAANRAFNQLRAESQATSEDLQSLQIELLLHLGELYRQKNWTAQFHLGALRNPNDSAYRLLGADSGFDSIGDSVPISEVSNLLSILAGQNSLPNSILYNLNPTDNQAFAAICGSFPKSGISHSIRHGAAWWFLDQRIGIEQQLDCWSQTGLLNHFPGMVTDSRSFLSFPRHEYFRRILCTWLGRESSRGLIPNDTNLLKPLVENICFNNSRKLFLN